MIQQRLEVFIVGPGAPVGMKAQRQVTEAVAQDRELGEGGLFVFLPLFRVFVLLFALLPTFAKVMGGLPILQASGVRGGVAQSLLQ